MACCKWDIIMVVMMYTSTCYSIHTRFSCTCGYRIADQNAAFPSYSFRLAIIALDESNLIFQGCLGYFCSVGVATCGTVANKAVCVCVVCVCVFVCV